MTKTDSRRRKVAMPFDIRKKFAAAICMLLIATIMMVSSSYAWFTLSTAPEVKGITTSVGANGNLEIALLSGTALFSTADDLGIVSAVGDSMTVKDVEEANATWGNLVDLSTAYGLNTVTLLPAALNIDAAEATIDSESLLLAPRYGSDGRVIDVKTQTLIGKYQNSNVYPLDDRANGNGVGIIGTASGRTERMNAYQLALSNANSYTNAARNGAQDILNTHGNDIASIFIKIASDTNHSDEYTKAELQMIGEMITGLQAANDNVFLAIKQIALASTLSNANTAGLSDEDVTTLVAAVEAATTIAELQAVANMRAFTTELQAAVDNYEATQTKISNAETTYTTLGVDTAADTATYTYAQVRDLIDDVIKKERVMVADVTNPTSADKQTLIDAATNGTAVPIKLLDGSGALYDIAKSAGNYSASGITAEVENNGLTVRPRVTISTAAEEPILLPAARDQAMEDGAPQNTSGGTGNIDNSYGYVIDFGFRTNAANAKLLLQQGGIQRIYSGDNASTNEQTLGGGSTLKFTSVDVNKFTVDDVRALMSAIRVVFVAPETADSEINYTIVAMAAPDITATTNDATGVTTYEGGTVIGTDTLEVNLALFEYETETVNTDEIVVKLGDKRDDLELVELEQNVAKKLTAIVYIDGDYVDNTMAANAATSMTGSLNLQFATDAELVPMENAALREGSNGSDTPAAPTVTKEKLSAAIASVKASEEYADEANTALIEAVAAAEAVVAQDEPEQSALNSAAQALAVQYALLNPTAAAAIAADLGITLP
ncbi:MAG: hypothetical protein IKH51_06230 [Clostridia bacterium]|nr:hypothetical protein [Clostridia bacterium]